MPDPTAAQKSDALTMALEITERCRDLAARSAAVLHGTSDVLLHHRQNGCDDPTLTVAREAIDVLEVEFLGIKRALDQVIEEG